MAQYKRKDQDRHSCLGVDCAGTATTKEGESTQAKCRNQGLPGAKLHHEIQHRSPLF